MDANSPKHVSVLIDQIRRQLEEARKNYGSISLSSSSRGGNILDNTIQAIEVDELRFYWGSRIKELDSRLNALLSQLSDSSSEQVVIGCTVMLHRMSDESLLVLRFVDQASEIPGEKCITPNSPLGKSLIGAMKGSTIKIQIPRGEEVYTIVDVN